MKFALFFGNRGFFPESLVASARREMCEAVTRAGHEYICLDENATKYGAISCGEDGLIYAAWLKKHYDEVDGAIMCLPNFSDETGAVKAFRNFKKPILIQAYPDELGKMSPAERRDSFCGKISICNYFNQCGIKYTVFKPHVVNPLDERFIEQVRKFAKICRVANGLKGITVGAIGARVTAFKTVRYDEVILEKNGITVEQIDLSELFARVNLIAGNDPKVLETIENFHNYTNCNNIPENRLAYMAKVTVGILNYVEEYHMDALAIRCWNEFPEAKGICVCFLVAYLNQIGIPTACEVDVYNAIAMKALVLAGEAPATVMDWNNNYGDDPNKCVLFHCGPTAKDMLEDNHKLIVHTMFAKTCGASNAWGAMAARLKKGAITYLSLKVEDSKIHFFNGKAKITTDDCDKTFFGTYGVAEFRDLEELMLFIERENYHHHVSYAYGDEVEVLNEALGNYLDYTGKTI